jgi:beta-fructofuranosidase
VLQSADAWVWDFWLADDGESYHLFFLTASRLLGDPDLRHGRANIGHAKSPDLITWTSLPDALIPSPSPAFDEVATWTGSILRAPNGSWHMYYTGVSEGTGGRQVQRIGLATSQDLYTWQKYSASPVLIADDRWYQPDAVTLHEAWRDPWVFADPENDGWHMLLTAKSNYGPLDDRGVLGHARSADLVHWEAQPPISAPGAGFMHLEVPQVDVVDGRPILVFSCLRPHPFAVQRASRPTPVTAGVWSCPGDSLLGPFDLAKAQPLTDDAFYSGRIIQDREGRWVLLAFHCYDEEGAFVGEISDPMPIGWASEGTLTIDHLSDRKAD